MNQIITEAWKFFWATILNCTGYLSRASFHKITFFQFLQTKQSTKYLAQNLPSFFNVSLQNLSFLTIFLPFLLQNVPIIDPLPKLFPKLINLFAEVCPTLPKVVQKLLHICKYIFLPFYHKGIQLLVLRIMWQLLHIFGIFRDSML